MHFALGIDSKLLCAPFQNCVLLLSVFVDFPKPSLHLPLDVLLDRTIVLGELALDQLQVLVESTLQITQILVNLELDSLLNLADCHLSSIICVLISILS